MKKILLLPVLMMLMAPAKAQHIASYSADNVMQRASDPDTTYIINFWATWCMPCVEELPVFNALTEKYAGKPVKILLVSLDFKESYPDKIEAFIKKKQLKPEVVWFNETDANIFIPKIENSWSGSIPATLVIHKRKNFRWFKENSITEKIVSDVVDAQLAR